MSHTKPLISLCLLLVACSDAVLPDRPAVGQVADIAQLSSGWNGELIATVDQSYAGWDVEIADLDGDGIAEVLTGTGPDSRIDLQRLRGGTWTSTTLVEHLATDAPGMVLGVRAVDMNGDGHPEVIAGTGQENGDVARLAILELDGDATMTRVSTMQAPENGSSYTHGLATADLDHDGRPEIVSAYCGDGEVIRYDVDANGGIESRKLMQASGSGEDALLVDVDGDGKVELVVSNGFRDRDAKIEIYDLDPVTGDPLSKPRLVIDAFEGHHMFYASAMVGDLDGDGRPELVVGWKQVQDKNRASLVAYHIEGTRADVAYVLAREDGSFDLGYFEKMMAIADVDGDGRAELLVSTRGDGESEGIPSTHAGQVYAFRVDALGTIKRDLIVDFDPAFAESSWLAVGDIENDGRMDIVLATGRGDRLNPGWSWIVRLWHD